MVLGLTDDDFFALTPRQFHLLKDRHSEVIEHDELLTGIIASVVANYGGMVKPESPKVPTDYMPTQWAKNIKPKKKRKDKNVIVLDAFTEKMKSFMLAKKVQGKVIDAVTGEKIDFVLDPVTGEKLYLTPGGQPAPGGRKLV